jgi:PucR family transcriptional regulator, purine catabolism regulatory protein
VFTNLSLDSADPTAIVRAGADLIQAPLVLEDAGHHVVAFAQYDKLSRDLLNRWEERSRDTPVLEDPGTVDQNGWLTCPVGLRGAVWGRLIAPFPTADPVRSGMVLQRAAQALQMSRLVERDATRLQFQAQQSLLQELMNRKLNDEADAIARARALGMKGAKFYLPVVALFDTPGLSDQIAQQRRARAHLEIVSDSLRDAKVSAIASGIGDGRVGLLVALDRWTSEDDVLARLADAMANKTGLDTPVLGVGQAAGTLLTTALRLHNASHIADAANAIPSTSARWFRSTDVRLRGLIAQLQDDERLLGFMESELGALLAHDARYGTGLLDILRAYIHLGGNKQALASTAHISRQALYGRLRKLESILLVDLDNADSVLSLGVALLAYDTRRLAPAPIGQDESIPQR